MNLSHKPSSGFSLPDIVVSVAILAIGIAGIYGMFFYGIAALRAADNGAIANKNLLQRLGQLQNLSSWFDLTAPSYISTLLSTPITTTAQSLPGLTQESITISVVSVPYVSPVPSPTPSPTATPTPFTVTRSGASVNTTSSASLSGAAAVNVKLNVQWQDKSGRSHTREISTVLSSTGLRPTF
jgi:hypothetical protein